MLEGKDPSLAPDRSTYVAASTRMVGAALVKALEARAETPVVRGLDDDSARELFDRLRPHRVLLASGRAHGIAANLRSPADIMAENLFFECDMIRAAAECGVERLLYLASSCCYPRDCPQPMSPASIFSGPPEPSNHAYSVAKLAALTLCQAYRKQYGKRFVVAIPATPFGPGDDFRPESSHVVGALIRRMHEARHRGDEVVDVWGTGRPRRDFIYAGDLADACLFLSEHYDGETPVNVAGDGGHSIRELAEAVAEVVGFEGRLHFDETRPDGAPLKLLDASPLHAMGWHPATPLREALRLTYQAFLDQQVEAPLPA